MYDSKTSKHWAFYVNLKMGPHSKKHDKPRADYGTISILHSFLK